MGIRTYQSLSGYVATDPRLEPTRDGTPRFYARAGQRQARREPDGNFTQLPTQYLPIVAFGDAAEEAGTLIKGDSFVAEGRFRSVSYDKDGAHIEGEEFEVFKIARRSHPAVNPGPADTRPLSPALPSQGLPAEFAAPRASSIPTAGRAL